MYFKDIADNKMILADNILFKLYLISDNLNNLRWNVTTEHQKISNYNCTKATLNFRGRNYTAWFAESIPLPLGPLKFGGLPGLIIKVSDCENKYVYERGVIALKAKFDERLVDTPQIYNFDKPLSHKGFIDIYNTKIESYKKMSRVVVTEANEAYGINSISLPEKQEKF
nr:GLPGLI family protein [Pedobacter sp. KBS0701]